MNLFLLHTFFLSWFYKIRLIYKYVLRVTLQNCEEKRNNPNFRRVVSG